MVVAHLSPRTTLASEDRTASGGAASSTSGFASLSSSVPMSAVQISCLLTQVGVSPKTALNTGKDLELALKMMHFSAKDFNSISMMHFLAQINTESKGGLFLTQLPSKKRPRRDKCHTGYGHIQVTGCDNLRDVANCMNAHVPGAGDGVFADPEHTIGKRGEGWKAGLASFCWWERNVIGKARNQKYATDLSDEAAHRMTRIVNGGNDMGLVTNGIHNINIRKTDFEIMRGSTQCRQYSI